MEYRVKVQTTPVSVMYVSQVHERHIFLWFSWKTWEHLGLHSSEAAAWRNIQYHKDEQLGIGYSTRYLSQPTKG